MTTSEIYGSIGAAKAFSSNVKNSLGLQIYDNENEIERNQSLIDSGSGNKNLKRRNRVLKTKNGMLKAEQKVAETTNQLLVSLASFLDVTEQEIIKFIANVIVNVLPALELSVKGMILTNLKKMISCSIDPRIPDEWRDEGMIFNEAMIDPRQILKASPYSRLGKYLYFGVYDNDIDSENNTVKEDKKNQVSLGRAEDMNAFLWYARNCAKFVSPNIINDCSNVFDDVDSGTTLYNTHVFKGKDEYRYIESSLFKQTSNSATMFICEKREMNEDGTFYTIIPVTDRWTGITWYKDRVSLHGKEKHKDINYDKSKPLFNIEYLKGYDENWLYPDGNFRFRILPKPFSTAGGFIASLSQNISEMSEVIGNDMVNEIIDDGIVKEMPKFKFQGIQSPLPYYARFNSNGLYDKKGRYSIDNKKYSILPGRRVEINESESEENPIIKKYIEYEIFYDNVRKGILLFDIKNKTFSLVDINENNEYVELTNVEKMELLTECYTGWSIYEFNYDYVVSMKLFDEKSIACGIVDSLMNIDIPFSSSNDDYENSRRNIEQIRIDSYVDKLIEKMINEETGEFTDCFYSFSNEDYESMEKDVAKKIANNSFVTDSGENIVKQVYSIIDAYDADASLNKKTETITMAITKASEACGFDNNIQGNIPLENINTPYPITDENQSAESFIDKMVKFLITAIVNSILTPKVLLLLQVNQRMMGRYALPSNLAEFQDRYNNPVDEILNNLSSLLNGIIKEVIDTIHKELLRLILERLSEVTASYISKLGIEYAMKWVNIIKQLFACIPSGGGGMSLDGYNYLNGYRNTISSILDDVDYADIDQSIDEIIPNTNPC